MVRTYIILQTYILINRIESCLIMVSGEISIASYNWNGLADNKKRLSVFTWPKEKEYNIYCLQEIHSTILDEVLWEKDWGSKYISPTGKEIQKGF